MKRIFCSEFFLLSLLTVLPMAIYFTTGSAELFSTLRPILIFALLGLGLNVVTGFAGLLNLGVAAFMAIGAYSYAIASCDIYPFQLGFWLSVAAAIVVGVISGVLLGLPTLGLAGDYFAVVTLGFGEIVQDLLRNLEVITKGTQGINPLPTPVLGNFSFTPQHPIAWYYLYLALLLGTVVFLRNIVRSRIGRAWRAVREDQLAASCMGIRVVKTKLIAFATSAGIAAFAGALWAAHLGSTGEPGNFDFQVSVIALCIVIVGGLGNLAGVLLGAFIMVGLNSLVLTRLTAWLADEESSHIYSNPNNWKYGLFGLALVLMMRFRPNGIIPRDRSF